MNALISLAKPPWAKELGFITLTVLWQKWAWPCVVIWFELVGGAWWLQLEAMLDFSHQQKIEVEDFEGEEKEEHQR